jgi:hypothetical protein
MVLAFFNGKGVPYTTIFPRATLNTDYIVSLDPEDLPENSPVRKA